jgi:hypothetical protein
MFPGELAATAGLVLFEFVDPGAEFELADLFAAGEEFELPLFAAADVFALPGFEFVFELRVEAGELSRDDEFRLLLLELPGLAADEVRLLAFPPRGVTAAVASDQRKSPERFAAGALPPPGAAITTSNLLPRCST